MPIKLASRANMDREDEETATMEPNSGADGYGPQTPSQKVYEVRSNTYSKFEEDEEDGDDDPGTVKKEAQST